MFSQTKPTPFNYEGNMEPGVLDTLSRIEDLDSHANEIDRMITIRELQWDGDMSDMRRQLKVLNADLDRIKASIEEFKKVFTAAVNKLRESINQEDFEKLEQKIDSLHLENLVSKQEFSRMQQP